MMGTSPKAYIQSFVEIKPLVLEEKFFEVFFHIWAPCHLGHLISIVSTNSHYLVPESLHIKFGLKWPMVSEKKPVLIFISK